MRARAPASSANLGPGFDSLALALARHVEVEIRPSDDGLVVHTSGEGSELPKGTDHLAVRIAAEVLGHFDFEITVRSNIPMGRGLGSSGALAVAAAAAAGAPDPLAVAAASEGHAENAAASVHGGLVAASMVNGHAMAAPLALDPELSFVVLVPARQLPTKRAREALPAHVTHNEAAFNLGRMGLLLAGLADHRLLVHEATDDKLHQSARAPLFPEASNLLRGLLDAGALASCWSGAGPSLLAICTKHTAASVRHIGERLLSESEVGGEAIVLDADREGLVVEE